MYSLQCFRLCAQVDEQVTEDDDLFNITINGNDDEETGDNDVQGVRAVSTLKWLPQKKPSKWKSALSLQTLSCHLYMGVSVNDQIVDVL